MLSNEAVVEAQRRWGAAATASIRDGRVYVVGYMQKATATLRVLGISLDSFEAAFAHADSYNARW